MSRPLAAALLSLSLAAAPAALAAQEAIDFRALFGRSWDEAITFLEERGAGIAAVLHECGAEPRELIPVVFPELVRADYLRDLVEESALRLLYVEGGERYANFSIGPFQMKPSFAVGIEEALAGMPGIPPCFDALLSYPAARGPARRKALVERLVDPLWQARYLAAFSLVAGARFRAELGALEGEGRIAFLATAYNAGFDRDVDYLAAASELALFPDRYFWRGPLVRYASVSRFFSEEEYPRLETVIGMR